MLKRTFDFIASALGLILLFPLLVAIAVWIKLDSPGPVFFRQDRVGRYGVTFRIHKFRTMSVNAEKAGRLTVGSDSRVTKSGQLLRKLKLDELPQLIDVFLGQMSLVGPRPELQEFIACYPDDVRTKVLSVRPGITDKASIEMVDENEILAKHDDPRAAYIDIVLPIKQRFYQEYVDDQTIILDIILILKTFSKIVKNRL